MAEFSTDDKSGKLTATLSTPMDQMTGQLTGPYGSPTRWAGLVGPASSETDIQVDKANISKLDDKQLGALDSALTEAIGKGYDEAMYQAQVAVAFEEGKRKKSCTPTPPFINCDN